jgi:hypothetical protein
MASRRRGATGEEGRRASRVPRRSVRAAAPARSSIRKLVELDLETWREIDLLGRDTMKTFQELTDEAFADLLRKHGRTDTLRGALKRSAAADGSSAPRHSVRARPPARARRALRDRTS